MRKIYLLFVVFIFSVSMAEAQSIKKSLDHDVYDSWKDLSSSMISNDGKWVSFEINPQQGDGWLYLANPKTGLLDSVPRGYKAQFSADGNFLVYQIKAPYDSTRAAKLKKKKGKDLPQDSLGIWNISEKTSQKFANVKSYQLAESGNNILGFLFTDETEEADKKKKKKSDDTYSLKILDLNAGESFDFERASAFALAKNGNSLGFIQISEDSVEKASVSIFQTSAKASSSIYDSEGKAKSITMSEDGLQASFIASTDTGKQMVYDLWYWKNGGASASNIVKEGTGGMPSGWIVSENSRLSFSKDGSRLLFGTIPKPRPEVEDEDVLEEEKVKIDIWHWKDQRLQPQQLVQLSRDKRFNYQAVYFTNQGKLTQLADEIVHNIQMAPNGVGEYALGISNRMLMMARSWESPGRADVYLVNMNSGEKTPILKGHQSYSMNISPATKYITWFETADSIWYAYDIEEGKKINLTGDMEVHFFNRRDDRPQPARPYGLSGWGKDDTFVLLNDEFDIWKIDPKGKEAPVNITQGLGRENNIRFTNNILDRENPAVDSKGTLLLTGFNNKTKADGYYQLRLDKDKGPEELFVSDHDLGRPIKAKDANQIIWTKGSYTDYPDLWVSNLSMKKPKKLSNANPQQKEYKWGTVELMSWEAYDGQKLEGLLYKPENFDPNKKYPMIVYFYERRSDGLHRHQTPQPIRSSTYPSMYVSNDYVYFVPDVTYKTGQPGDDAYNCVVSGTEYLMKNSWVDTENIGIQGHSWGGYQIAYLITKTNIYKAAEAGAPVVNMTSAYGGIRWASGLSRMFQYEQTQSRLGATLWEAPELYLKNSPLFELDKVETPVMFMHNDNDGAVPWYQGIEYFVGLRRLGKPVWMLNYNGEGHGLSKRHNKRDFAIRMKQFFDHFLKGESAPQWIESGVPAIEKGRNMGF